ncbi:hypothetical protein DPMN_004003 [Dreissena polymorpha]|uniref:Uncharacterized protein n=1 Tax=Dreissena polymorpha TaxID=45954 RepID=A0A9D4MQ01_DREPO|nr:hypothetical protein DPMN_004003 [Dreissena polymorpha]
MVASSIVFNDQIVICHPVWFMTPCEFIYRSYWPLHEVTVARPAPVTSQEKKINFRVKLPKGGDEERIPPSVPHITNVQDTQRDPQPNTTRYIGPGTHTRTALTPPPITGDAYESATPVRSGFLGGDVYGCVYSQIAEPAAPHKRTHAERARAPPPLAPAYCPGPSTQPLKTPETSTLIHPLAARDNISVENQPWSHPKPYPESPSFLPTRLPNIQTVYLAGMY